MISIRNCTKGVVSLLTVLFFTISGASAESTVSKDLSLSTLVCPGTQGVTATPGITSIPREVTYSGGFVVGPCVGLDTNEIVWGYGESPGKQVASCDLTPDFTGFGGKIYWSNGTTSVYDTHLSLRETLLGGNTLLTQYATITSGSFVGANMVKTFTLLTLDLNNCSKPKGFTSSAGPVTITITGLL